MIRNLFFNCAVVDRVVGLELISEQKTGVEIV